MNFLDVPLFLCLMIIGSYVGNLLNPIIFYLPKLTKLWLLQELQELNNSSKEISANDLGDNAIRGACTTCHNHSQNRHRLSLFNWIEKKGVCEYCNGSMSIKAAVVDLVCGLIPLAIIYQFGYEPYTISILFFAYCITVIVFTDIETYIVPDAIVIPLIWIGLTLALFDYSNLTVKEALLGCICGYISLWALSKAAAIFAKSDEMGKGDFKVMASFGAWFGVDALPVSLLATFLIAGVVLVFKRDQSKIEVAFVPYIALGWALSIYLGDSVNDWWGWLK